MADRLLVATRKGLFDFERGHHQWQIVRHDFLGEPVSMVLHHKGVLYAALNLGHFGCKLHRSDDEGLNWREIAAPSYPKTDEDGPSLSLIWCLEGAGDTLWAGTIPGGLFRSDDGGASWQLNESLWNEPSRAQWFGGGYDQPGIHSICIDPLDSRRLTVGVSCGGVWTTKDAGQTWASACEGMRADYMPPEQRHNPAIQDPHRLVQCAASPEHFWVQHHNGIFRSDDYCASWTEIKADPSSFGFAVAVHPRDPDIAWFVPAIRDELRIPVAGRLVVTRTVDGGNSFGRLNEGLPEGEAYDLIYRHGLAVDGAGNSLAMGSTTGNLWVSNDGGEQWSLVSNHLPPIYAVRFVG